MLTMKNIMRRDNQNQLENIKLGLTYMRFEEMC
jgi:hypothetical protein